MEVFTQNWQHHSYSPSRFDEAHDLHAGKHKALICLSDKQRPDLQTPSVVRELEFLRDALSDDDFTGEIEILEMLRLLAPIACNEDVNSREIQIGEGFFDAWQVLDFCLAVINSEVIAWRVQKNDGPGFSLYLAGPEWVGVVAGFMGDGTGPQILP